MDSGHSTGELLNSWDDWFGIHAQIRCLNDVGSVGWADLCWLTAFALY